MNVPSYRPYRDEFEDAIRPRADTRPAWVLITLIALAAIGWFTYQAGFYTGEGNIAGKLELKSPVDPTKCYVEMVAEVATGQNDRLACYSDEHGKFSFKRAHKGSYDLYIYASGLDHWATTSEKVTVATGRTARVVIKIDKSQIDQMLAQENAYNNRKHVIRFG